MFVAQITIIQESKASTKIHEIKIFDTAPKVKIIACVFNSPAPFENVDRILFNINSEPNTAKVKA